MPLKAVLKTGAERIGLRPTPKTRHTQRALLLGDLSVDLVLDVGANLGQYAGIHLREWAGYRGRIASFEPVASCYARCAISATDDPLWATFSYGLSDIDATVPISVPTGQEDLSSLHAFAEAGARMVETTTISVETVSVRRLDRVIGEIARPLDRLALKLDVQGHEAAVLRGAERTLERVVLIECEMPLVRMYNGQSTFAELLSVLAGSGFSPVGMASNYVDPATGRAMDADVFLVRM
jgi:FkbM family methyltransferase